MQEFFKELNKELKFAFYATKKNIANNAELRTSFIMNVAGMAINNYSFVFLWVYFVKSVGVIGGWTSADVIALQGFDALAFGLIFSVGLGIIKLPTYVSSGAFDRFMLSPKNLIVRVATSAFSSSAVGDMLFGIVCLIFYALYTHASYVQVIMLAYLISMAMLVFLAMAIAVHSTGFFFVDASRVTRSLFELFLTPAMFHGGAFQGVMRVVFTFVIPSLLIGTLPVEAVRDLSFSKLLLITVLAVAWLLIALKIFEKAVKHYESSNFMTFGN